MPDKTDFFMAPVGAGMCKYESLLDGTIGLVDVLRMNNYLAVRAENTSRLTRR